MNLAKPTNNLMSNLMVHGTKSVEVQVGMGATMCWFSDRHAGTVVAIRRFKTGKRAGQVKEIDVQEDKATRTDNYGMSDAQSYSYAADPNGNIRTFKAKLRGGYSDGSVALAVGYRSEFYDYTR